MADNYERSARGFQFVIRHSDLVIFSAAAKRSPPAALAMLKGIKSRWPSTLIR
jgi:hypothetical protein